jgi:hypothetical protein
MIYAMVKIDGYETLCIGGKIIPDDEQPGFLWLTNIQGEKLLHIHHLDYRAVTEDEARDHLNQAHARREAAGEDLEIAVVKIKKETPPKQDAMWPEPPSKPWNN